MNVNFSLFGLLILLLGLWSCANEKDFPENNRYPYLEITDAVADSAGIKVTAAVITPGKGSVTEYGFNYHPINKPQQKIKVKALLLNNQFKLHIKDKLVRNVVYQVSAYAVVDDKTVHSSLAKVESVISSKPVITDISPLEGASGKAVTISGNMLTDVASEIEVFFGTVKATVVIIDFNRVVVIVPNTPNFGSYPVKVIVNGAETIYDKPFTILGPQITGISKTKGIPGDTLTLFGKNLSLGEKPVVYQDNAAFIVHSFSNTKVKLEVPVSYTANNNITAPVYLKTNGKTVSSSFAFTMHISFNTVTPLNQKPRYNHMPAIEADGKGYFFDHNRVLSYNTATGVWREESKFPGVVRSGFIWQRVGDKAYLIGGSNEANAYGDVWEYDYKAATWRELPGFHFKVWQAISFVLNGKLYFGGGSNNHGSLTFWRYDPGTGELVQLNSLPSALQTGKAFTWQGNGNLLVGTAWYEYNQAADSWRLKRQLSEVYRAVFILNDTDIYFFGGAHLYKYSVNTDAMLIVAGYPNCTSNHFYGDVSGFTTRDSIYMGIFNPSYAIGTCLYNFYSYKQP